jgi:hypothetical protein
MSKQSSASCVPLGLEPALLRRAGMGPSATGPAIEGAGPLRVRYSKRRASIGSRDAAR